MRSPPTRYCSRTDNTFTDIREVLLFTGDELIVENSPIDYYWACGTDGSGKNMLGQILMEVREILRDARARTSPT